MTDFDPEQLLCRREDGHLEFKDAEVMRRPVNVAREVVGFLNADGGEIWIGIKEGEPGRAEALQALQDPEADQRSLFDHLVGVIEPAFSQEEVEVQVVGTGARRLIRVSVRKGAHPPYAVRDGGRRFLIRVADRLNEMTREQIREAFVSGAKESGRSVSTLKEDLRTALNGDGKGQALAKDQLWLRLAPAESLEIDFTNKETQELFSIWFRDPKATGNRPNGSFFASRLQLTRFLGDRLQHGEDADPIRTIVTERGEVTFAIDVLLLSNYSVDPRRFEPYALLEYPVSVFRLMAKILRQFGQGHPNLRLFAGFSMKGIRGWTLAAGSPREPTPWLGLKAFDEDVLKIDPERLAFDAEMLKQNPDRCALRLIRLSYGSVGFEDDAIPNEYDQKRGLLVLP